VIRPLTLPDAIGGDGILSYTLTPTLPAGLTLTMRTIAGTPTGVAQTTTYTWTVIDSNNASARLMFTIAVHATSVCLRTPQVRDAIVRRQAVSSAGRSRRGNCARSPLWILPAQVSRHYKAATWQN